MVCPRGRRRDLVAAKLLDDVACGSIAQAALAELMRSGAFDRHLRHAGAELRRRRAALLDGLRSHCGHHLKVTDSRAGLHSFARAQPAGATNARSIRCRATRVRGTGPLNQRRTSSSRPMPCM